MSAEMSDPIPTHRQEYVPIVVADLLAVSAELLEPGAGEAEVHRAAASSSSLLSILRGQVRRGLRLTREVLTSECPSLEDGGEWQAVKTPSRARPPRVAHAYTVGPRGGAALVPTHWERHESRFSPSPMHLGFNLQMLELLRALVLEKRKRLVKHLEQAMLARSGSSAAAGNADGSAKRSRFAAAEYEALAALRQELDQWSLSLRRAVREVQAFGGFRVRASGTLPPGTPNSPTWRKLRLLMRELRDPRASLPQHILATLGAHAQAASWATLYQRWCGVKLLQSFERRGWRVIGDSLGPVFLGGSVALQQGLDAGASGQVVQLTVWFEPRILQGVDHPSGLRAQGECSPDIVVAVPGLPGPTGRAALEFFVLDPTTSGDDELQRKKARYLTLLSGREMRRVAGAVHPRPPLAAFAAAPLQHPAARVQLDGRSGVIPITPGAGVHTALDAWVEEIEAHAVAWGR